MSGNNSYFVLGPERARRVQLLFTRIAARYDLLNDLLSFGLHRLWKRAVRRFARVTHREIALDVCCGTGDLVFGLAARGAFAVGCDFSQPMLKIAQTRNRGGTFVQCDALALPFANETVDCVTIAYGLRNLASTEHGLIELLRVLKPGGRLIVLDCGKPANPAWRAIYFAYMRFAVPVLGQTCAGDREAYAYLLESLQHYPAQEGVAALLRQTGCLNNRVINLLGGAMSINYAEKPHTPQPAR